MPQSTEMEIWVSVQMFSWFCVHVFTHGATCFNNIPLINALIIDYQSLGNGMGIVLSPKTGSRPFTRCTQTRLNNSAKNLADQTLVTEWINHMHLLFYIKERQVQFWKCTAKMIIWFDHYLWMPDWLNFCKRNVLLTHRVQWNELFESRLRTQDETHFKGMHTSLPLLALEMKFTRVLNAFMICWESSV